MNIFQLIAKYRYHLLFVIFGVWIVFLDSNNLIYRWRLNKEIREIKKSIATHKQSISELRYIQRSILGNKSALEKFARETYFMKKDDEDLFVINEPIIDVEKVQK